MPATQTYNGVLINVHEVRIKEDESLEVRCSGAMVDTATMNDPDPVRKVFDGALVPLTPAQHTSLKQVISAATMPIIRNALNAPAATYDINQQGNLFVEVPKP